MLIARVGQVADAFQNHLAAGAVNMRVRQCIAAVSTRHIQGLTVSKEVLTSLYSIAQVLQHVTLTVREHILSSLYSIAQVLQLVAPRVEG